MIVGRGVRELVKLFQQRRVDLFHACQLRDLQSYVTLGGVPSRALLTSSGLSFTTFETDQNDQDNDVWDKVFFNLEDFGWWFQDGRAAGPNPYGPILLRLAPEALDAAEDVAISLRLAGAAGFSREREALGSVSEVDQLFRFPVDHPSSMKVKDQFELQVMFEDAKSIEGSCSIRSDLLDFKHLWSVLVDPYPDLAKAVERAVDGYGVATKQRSWLGDGERVQLYGEIWDVLRGGPISLDELVDSPYVSRGLFEWAASLEDKDWLFRRFANYLREGTIDPLLAAQRRTRTRLAPRF